MAKLINIPTPCHEDWNKMSPRDKARFCDSCAKEVVDFTQYSSEEIQEYFTTHSAKRTCGHFRKDQLQPSVSDLVRLASQISHHPNGNRLYAYLLSIGTLLSAGCQPTGPNAESQPQPLLEQLMSDSTANDSLLSTIADTIAIDTSFQKVCSKQKNDSASNEIGKIRTLEVLGDVDIVQEELGEVETRDIVHLKGIVEAPDTNRTLEKEPEAYVQQPQSDEIFQFIEIMPEFPGGNEALFHYIDSNLVYPLRPKELGIQGKVYAEFVVRKDGTVENPKILRGVAGAPEFDEAVIHLINNMPKWTPGKQRGRKASVLTRIPVSFRLPD